MSKENDTEILIEEEKPTEKPSPSLYEQPNELFKLFERIVLAYYKIKTITKLSENPEHLNLGIKLNVFLKANSESLNTEYKQHNNQDSTFEDFKKKELEDILKNIEELPEPIYMSFWGACWETLKNHKKNLILPTFTSMTSLAATWILMNWEGTPLYNVEYDKKDGGLWTSVAWWARMPEPLSIHSAFLDLVLKNYGEKLHPQCVRTIKKYMCGWNLVNNLSGAVQTYFFNPQPAGTDWPSYIQQMFFNIRSGFWTAAQIIDLIEQSVKFLRIQKGWDLAEEEKFNQIIKDINFIKNSLGTLGWVSVLGSLAGVTGDLEKLCNSKNVLGIGLGLTPSVISLLQILNDSLKQIFKKAETSLKEEEKLKEEFKKSKTVTGVLFENQGSCLQKELVEQQHSNQPMTEKENNQAFEKIEIRTLNKSITTNITKNHPVSNSF